MSVRFSNNGKINDLTVEGEILHRRATERSRDESSLWLFSINIPVYLQRLDGWCNQSKPQRKFWGGRKSRHLVWRLTQEEKLSSSSVALDIFDVFRALTHQGQFQEPMFPHIGSSHHNHHSSHYMTADMTRPCWWEKQNNLAKHYHTTETDSAICLRICLFALHWHC